MEYFTDTDIMLLNFEIHYKEKIKAKGLDLFDAGKSFKLMQNMFLNPFEVGTSDLCKESYVLFDILDLEDYQGLLGLRKTLTEEYDDNIFDKFTFVNMLTNESTNKYYLKSNVTYRVL